MILRLLGWQGIAGIGLGVALAILLVIQKAETRHWQKQSASFERLYHQEQLAFSQTVVNYRAAAEQARAADRANADRVAAESQAINERISHDFEVRLAAARADAQRLRVAAEAGGDPRPGRDAPMSGLSAAAAGPGQAAGQDRLSLSDALMATEQAIQLDELIKWLRQQHALDPNGTSPKH